jgi:hypothetical protein
MLAGSKFGRRGRTSREDFRPDAIIAKLREADVVLGLGMDVAAAAKAVASTGQLQLRDGPRPRNSRAAILGGGRTVR